MFGEVNVPAQQFATTLIPQGAGANLDVLQDGNAVVGYDTQAGALVPINASSQLLPNNLLPAPPVYAKVNPADAPVITLGISS